MNMGKVRRKVRFALAYELGLYSYIPRVPPIFEMENEKYFRNFSSESDAPRSGMMAYRKDTD